MDGPRAANRAEYKRVGMIRYFRFPEPLPLYRFFLVDHHPFIDFLSQVSGDYRPNSPKSQDSLITEGAQLLHVLDTCFVKNPYGMTAVNPVLQLVSILHGCSFSYIPVLWMKQIYATRRVKSNFDSTVCFFPVRNPADDDSGVFLLP